MVPFNSLLKTDPEQVHQIFVDENHCIDKRLGQVQNKSNQILIDEIQHFPKC